jgi:WD repeat-containing protein 55
VPPRVADASAPPNPAPTKQVEVWEHSIEDEACTLLKTLKCHDDACRSIAFANDGALLLSGGSDRSILASDVATGAAVARLENAHKAAINKLVALDANILATGDDDGVVKVWDTRTRRACGSFAPFVDFVSDIYHVPASAAADVDDAVANSASAAAGNPAGTLVIASGDGTIAHLNLATWKELGQSDNLEDELLSCCVMKHGKKAVAGSQGGILNIFDYGEWEDISDRFPGHPSSIDAIVKVDEDTILTGSADGLIRVINIHPNKMLGLVGEHGEMPVERMDLSVGNQWLATASHDRSVKLWSVGYLWEEDDDEDDLKEKVGEEEEEEEEDSDDSDDDGGGGKRKRKQGKKKKGKNKVKDAHAARADAKKRTAKKFFEGL